MGTAYGEPTNPVEITITWEGETVFSGPVPTTDDDLPRSWQEQDILCTWEFAQDIDTMPDGCSHGIPLHLLDSIIPITVSVKNGEVLHCGIAMNYRGPETEIRFVENPQWGTYVPETIEEFIRDITSGNLGFHGFEAKYGLPWARTSELVEDVVIASPEEAFKGFGPKKHKNITLDGVAFPEPNALGNNLATSPRSLGMGNPHRTIPDGSVLAYELDLTSPTGMNFDGIPPG